MDGKQSWNTNITKHQYIKNKVIPNTREKSDKSKGGQKGHKKA